jgi:D-tagatose-1,6-bisphosphate aldolase subunit GatZ/KbaZ
MMMKDLNAVVKKIIDFRINKNREMTLLAVCPNSEAVLEAAVKAAAKSQSIMLFAATLNQVDTDGGYTGWTPGVFVEKMQTYREKYGCHDVLYPCLDHGGPWLKDIDTINKLSFEATFGNVKNSITACIKAGYSLLHIDPTVDRSLKPGEIIAMETVVTRTVELIKFAEQIREQNQLPLLSYEVGTEEVHGGMVDLANFERFIALLREEMAANGVSHVWPCFFVAQVGTDLHTTKFDKEAACAIYQKLYPNGSLAKGHYSDWVENPDEYPQSGMGGANVGPEFTAEEFLALKDLADKEIDLCKKDHDIHPSEFMDVLKKAVIESNRWKKWLQPDEIGKDFDDLDVKRQLWLIQTGSRYLWTAPQVVESRRYLYNNLQSVMPDPHQYVVDRIVGVIEKYLVHFNLINSSQYFK